MSIQLWRVVQDQESYYKKITGLDYEEAFELNFLLEKSKPLLPSEHEEWDELIYTPFRYPLPVGVNFGSRFKAPMANYNLLYASTEKETSFAEAAHHMIAERAHLANIEDEVVGKTSFSFDLINIENINDITKRKDLRLIMSDDYSHSYLYASKAIKKANGFKYPSARLAGGVNYAIKEIKILSKEVRHKESLAFKFNGNKRSVEIDKYLGGNLFKYNQQNIFEL